MTDSNAFASLSPSLLARKGGARPAMRSQLMADQQFQANAACQIEDDCGWNDMGDTDLPGQVAPIAFEPAQVVRLDPVKPAPAKVVRAQAGNSRRAALTLRVDPERHLMLRLACTIFNRSAQQLVTEALDRMIADIPEVTSLAAGIKARAN